MYGCECLPQSWIPVPLKEVNDSYAQKAVYKGMESQLPSLALPLSLRITSFLKVASILEFCQK